jgi:uncharacterized protein (TIGR02145 family)
MKSVKLIATMTVLLFMVTNGNAQENRDMKIYYRNGTTQQVAVSEIDSIKFVPFEEEQGIVINGIRWATRNVDMPGTFAAKPEDAGMFYQWNRKIGWSSTDPRINSNGSTVWDSSEPAGTTWEKANDPCPTGWRVPTKAELENLASASSSWAPLNGISGRYVGNAAPLLFLPAAGYRTHNYGALDDVGSGGLYWSSGVSGTYAASLLFGSGYFATTNSTRAGGFSLRCVAE